MKVLKIACPLHITKTGCALTNALIFMLSIVVMK